MPTAPSGLIFRTLAPLAPANLVFTQTSYALGYFCFALRAMGSGFYFPCALFAASNACVRTMPLPSSTTIN